MNGAESLVRTLVGVEVCFANPGTSEMHFAALDRVDGMRCVLGLFEGLSMDYPYAGFHPEPPSDDVMVRVLTPRRVWG